MQHSQTNPFILTLAIDEEAALFFNQQRKQYFPPDRNFLQAHLTLFHYLPLPAEEIITQLQPMLNETSTFTIKVIDIVSLGKGVAYKLESKELQSVHYRLQQLWKPLLKPQDLQKIWPHITIQNKVTPQQSKELLVALKVSFEPFSFKATGFAVWEYLNGPWSFFQSVNFSSETHL